MATGKSDDQFIQFNEKLKLGPVEIGTNSEKLRHWPWLRGNIARCEHLAWCVCANDDMTIIVYFHIDNTNTWVSVSHLAHIHCGSSHKSCDWLMSLTCVHEVSDFLRFCSLLLHALLVTLFPLVIALEIRRLFVAHTAQRECGFGFCNCSVKIKHRFLFAPGAKAKSTLRQSTLFLRLVRQEFHAWVSQWSGWARGSRCIRRRLDRSISRRVPATRNIAWACRGGCFSRLTTRSRLWTPLPPGCQVFLRESSRTVCLFAFREIFECAKLINSLLVSSSSRLRIEQKTGCLDIQLGMRLLRCSRTVGFWITTRTAAWSLGMDCFSKTWEKSRVSAIGRLLQFDQSLKVCVQPANGGISFSVVRLSNFKNTKKWWMKWGSRSRVTVGESLIPYIDSGSQIMKSPMTTPMASGCLKPMNGYDETQSIA